jgi:uncharacterized repeat protein (TIGR02543 family)
LTDASPYAEGTSVSIKATANPGYDFVGWTASAGTFTGVGWPQAAFAMPAQNVTVTANFVRVYDLTVVGNPVGQGTATDLTRASPYAEGTSVSIRAVANSGYHFVNWTAPAGTFDDAAAAQTTFTMPGQSVTVIANFAVDLYFWTDTCAALNGPSTLPAEERNPCIMLATTTNIVVDSVRVDLPDGRSITVPSWTDVFDPEAEGTPVFRFYTCEPGMATAGGEYVFTGLDAAGEPIPGARDTDIWVGVEPPDPPTNLRAEVIEDGILVTWEDSPTVPGSFEPAAEPQLGCYQLVISTIKTGGSVYGANCIPTSSYVIPRNKAGFVEGRDSGLSLSEMEDGTYRVYARVLSVPPEGSLGTGLEHNNCDPDQHIIFTIQDGEIVIG